jgi:hypothetical protein
MVTTVVPSARPVPVTSTRFTVAEAGLHGDLAGDIAGDDGERALTFTVGVNALARNGQAVGAFLGDETHAAKLAGTQGSPGWECDAHEDGIGAGSDARGDEIDGAGGDGFLVTAEPGEERGGLTGADGGGLGGGNLRVEHEPVEVHEFAHFFAGVEPLARFHGEAGDRAGERCADGELGVLKLGGREFRLGGGETVFGFLQGAGGRAVGGLQLGLAGEGFFGVGNGGCARGRARRRRRGSRAGRASRRQRQKRLRARARLQPNQRRRRRVGRHPWARSRPCRSR